MSNSHIWLVMAGLDSSDYKIFPSLKKVLLGINELEDNTRITFKIAVIINTLKYKHRKCGEHRNSLRRI